MNSRLMKPETFATTDEIRLIVQDHLRICAVAGRKFVASTRYLFRFLYFHQSAAAVTCENQAARNVACFALREKRRQMAHGTEDRS